MPAVEVSCAAFDVAVRDFSAAVARGAVIPASWVGSGVPCCVGSRGRFWEPEIVDMYVSPWEFVVLSAGGVSGFVNGLASTTTGDLLS